MSLKEQIISDMTAAMKAQDAARTSTLRMVKAAIMNREKDGGGEITDEDVQKLLRSQVKQRRDSVEQYQKANRPDLADKEQAEIAIIEDYLPQVASQEDIDQAVTGRNRRNGRIVNERHGRGDEGRDGQAGGKKCRREDGQ